MGNLAKHWGLPGWKSAAALIGLLLISVVGGAADNSGGGVPKPVIAPARADKCVANTEYMRRNHMKLLLHERDEEVHYGVRNGNNSLENCVNCHASRKNNSVLGSNQNFCQSCHSYAAVKIDCFECHSNKPQTNADVTIFHPLLTSTMATEHTDPGALRLEMLMRRQMLDTAHGTLNGTIDNNLNNNNLGGAGK